MFITSDFLKHLEGVFNLCRHVPVFAHHYNYSIAFSNLFQLFPNFKTITSDICYLDQLFLAYYTIFAYDIKKK